MPSELPTAVLTVSRVEKGTRRWSVKLTPRTPLEHEALKAALVARFVDDPEVKPESFDLTVSGTAGAPEYFLKEREEFFGEAEEIT